MAQDPVCGVIEALDGLQTALDKLRASLVQAEPTVNVRLVSLKEDARQLGMHEKTLRRHAKAGAGVKVGGVWRVDIKRLIAR